jgi:hypothetical protein
MSDQYADNDIETLYKISSLLCQIGNLFEIYFISSTPLASTVEK